MNRSGVAFTLVAFFIAAVLIGMAYSQERADQPTEHLFDVRQADHFLQQIEMDLERALRIMGYRAMLGMEEHVSATGDYMPNMSESFISMLTNGTINGTYYEIMNETTLEEFNERMRSIAALQGFDFGLRVVSVELGHVSPWSVGINATTELFLATADNRTRWNYTTLVQSEASVIDLKDPLYSVGTLGRVPTTVRRTNVSRPFIDASNDTTNLQVIFNNSMYVEDPSAPSLLMRFSGNLSNSTHGIASLVDTKVLDDQSLVTFPDTSVVDYLYFNESTKSVSEVVNMPEYFLLDDDHLELFDADGKTVS